MLLMWQNNLNNPNNVYVGVAEFSAHYFNGTIDEIRISNIARDFTQPQQGWTYTCIGSGETKQCGDILVTRTKGLGDFTPILDINYVPTGKSVRFRDLDCRGKCEYIFTTLSVTQQVDVLC